MKSPGYTTAPHQVGLWWPGEETACRETVRVTGSTPDAGAVAVYRGLYPALKGTFVGLG